MAEICRIKCTVSPGMFTDEFLAKFPTLGPDGTTHIASTIVSKCSINFERAPRAGAHVPGTLRAYCMDKKDNLVSVILPQTTLENGPSVIVPATEVVPG